MPTYTHVCIKPSCGQSYSSEDPDRYYCPPCIEAKKQLAAEIDQAVANRPSKLPRTSALQEYDADQNKVGGFIRATL